MKGEGMKELLPIQTHTRTEMIDITERVQEILERRGIRDGICVLFVPHTTASVTINENADPDVSRDLLEHLSTLVPQKSVFRHLEGNSDSHIKTSLTGSSEMVIIENGHLILGTWQSIFFCEFDGPRKRQCYVKVLGD